MTEARTFIEFRPGMRRLIEDAIESLILLLDEIHGDDDLEDGADDEEGLDLEPSLGAPEPRTNGNFVTWQGDLMVKTFDQTVWCEGGSDDREDDHAERGIADPDGLQEQFGL
jgi:hypothetical protein